MLNKSLENPLKTLNGQASKTFPTGHIIQGYWAQGRPEGKIFLKTPTESVQVTFKKGLISRIHTEKQLLSIHFPYKFIQTDSIFIEVFDDSCKSWYSVLKIPMIYDFCEKFVNKKLENVKKLSLSSSCTFDGETYQNFPLGYGIFIENQITKVGIFDFTGFQGSRGYKIQVLKANFDFDDRLNGFGKEKLLHINLKYKGNFVNNCKEGLFNVYFEEFKAEVYFKNDSKVGLVKFFKKDKFLIECDTEIYIFIPRGSYCHIPEMNELVMKFTRAAELNEKYFTMFFEQSPKKKMLKIVNIERVSWISYEKLLFESLNLKSYSTSFKKYNDDDIFREVNNHRLSHGFGRVCYENGNYYVGNLNSSKREGLGTFFTNGKILYKGYWKDDLFHGQGRLFLRDFRIYGEWINGELKKVMKVYNT